MIKGEIKFNIGKNGITSGVIKSLELAFKTRKKNKDLYFKKWKQR